MTNWQLTSNELSVLRVKAGNVIFSLSHQTFLCKEHDIEKMFTILPLLLLFNHRNKDCLPFFSLKISV